MLAYKCRSVIGESAETQISQILTGRYVSKLKYLSNTIQTDEITGAIKVIAKTPIGLTEITRSSIENGFPYSATIDMQIGSLWHSNVNAFEDKRELKPTFGSELSADQLNKLINPKYVPFSHLIDKAILCKYSEEACASIMSGVRTSGICSLSKSFWNLQLWEKYGDNCKGIAIEYEVDGTPNTGFYPVKYTTEPARLDINKVVASLQHDSTEAQKLEIATEAFCTKTPNWSFEDEIRHIYIHADQYAPIGPIKRILLGPRMPKKHIAYLRSKYPAFDFIETKLSYGKIYEK